jgi:hypothetical protein
MEESARDRKRNSARKKSEFSVYSKKAVRATELRWTKEQQHAVGVKSCPVQVKKATKQKETKK